MTDDEFLDMFTEEWYKVKAKQKRETTTPCGHKEWAALMYASWSKGKACGRKCLTCGDLFP